MTPVPVGGPYFDELSVGQTFDAAPAVTLTSGLAATHQAILGDRLRLPLDAHLSAAVTGNAAPVAHAGLVCDLAIGQSTLATHHVKANLFYRGLRFHRYPHLGDTLYTRTAVVGLRENSTKPGRAPTGLAALRIRTTDQDGRTVLDFHRCAMLPLSPEADPSRTVHADDLSRIGTPSPLGRKPIGEESLVVPEGWDLSAYRERIPGPHFTEDLAGQVSSSSGDVVSGAPELARLTLNIAATHHDARVGQAGRLVYGGHTIGLALSQATRALPNLVTVLGWHSCDHTGPVHEGDTLTSELHIESARTLPDSDSGILELRSLVYAHDTEEPRPVLDWRFTALMA
ncbi:acyl dehydratase [Rhodococcus triatomae]|uniref:Acyl dehydratase n=1 Tax=Rhodococcus triatomae TaxID=300028 RepID=A0A1G8GF30_9NOCA|nr:MaoC family dehydratase [Rhodococcus triatomae]QNG20397.1 acyl dehydratase [Rhodococcus triatomae]QNG23687.1 acyl dehydratase [Rhodococcus triatomae]SDH93002.1 Acyl dehydratase [Rhodococcus triatomae]